MVISEIKLKIKVPQPVPGQVRKPFVEIKHNGSPVALPMAFLAGIILTKISLQSCNDHQHKELLPFIDLLAKCETNIMRGIHSMAKDCINGKKDPELPEKVAMAIMRNLCAVS
jgi:hypothetical protein